MHNGLLMACVLLLSMLGACDKNKMEWGRDPRYGQVTMAELPLELREAISRYDVLKSYSDFTLGVGIDFALYSSDQTYRTLVNENFHEVVAGYEMKHGSMVGADGAINFGPVDAVIDQLVAANLRVYGHTLVWHQNQNASYLNSLIAPTVVPAAGGSVLDVSPLADGSFSGWSRNNAGGMTLVDNGGLSNGPALRLEVTAAGNEWDTQLMSPGIPATAGHRYEISFWIKSDGPGNGRMSFDGMANNYPWLNGAALFETSGVWTKMTYSTSTLGADFTATASTIKLAFDLGKVPGVYYVDINSISVIDEDAAPTEYNHVPNGGFESGSLGDWAALNPGAGIEVVGEDVHAGSYAVKMTTSATAANAWDLQLESPGLPLQAGNDYTFSFYVKSSVAGQGRVSFPGLTNQYPWLDWRGTGAGESFTTGTDWSLISVDLDGIAYSSGTSVKLSFDFGYLPGVTYYIDDIKVVEKGGGGSPGGTLIIEKTPEEKKQLIGGALETWITAMVSHYQGSVHAWDVVNEPMTESGTLRTGANVVDPASDEFYWQDYLGEDYAVLAFNLARKQAKPTDKLFINDYNLESGSLAKLDGLIDYVNYMESQGAAVDGIGTQMHLSLSSNRDNIAAMFEKLAATGKLIKVSELDIQVGTTSPTMEQYAEQAALYRYVVEMYNTHIPKEQQFGITVWGISDNAQEHQYWLPEDAPNLWDQNYARKHAYKGFADGLAGRDVSEEFSGELEY
ncbi:Carbohydrate binding domain-containing protein [Parapedobacter koreensis]|uniref:endo-1,4-beta-xylanase n=2 Tax=Parapedobacter koreensis TaxID=332977 RepID=A0A1H7JRM6_9SPHI|nr:Carbohydrate binding domain-containing protein [Parapedobacter koreensis]